MLTRQERIFIALLVFAVASGAIVREIKKKNPAFAPDFLPGISKKEILEKESVPEDEGESGRSEEQAVSLAPREGYADRQTGEYIPRGELSRKGEDTGRQRDRFGKIDINTATQEEIEMLPGIGPSLATRIVRYRQENGPFSSIEELLRVKGIGKKTLEKLRPELAEVPRNQSSH